MTNTLYRFWGRNVGDCDRHGHHDGTGDCLLYVGKSITAINRIGQHSRDKDWFCEIASSSFEHFATDRELSDAEILAIKREKPKYNISYNKKVTQRRFSCSLCKKQIGKGRSHVLVREVGKVVCPRCANWFSKECHSELFPICDVHYHDLYDHRLTICTLAAVNQLIDQVVLEQVDWKVQIRKRGLDR